MYFYLQDDIFSDNFMNRINFSGIFSFKCGFEMLIAFLYMMHSMIEFTEQNLILMLIKSKPMNLNFDIMLGTWNWYILY
ncbi:hypothetical protein LEMLEM_LOCUS24140 [Lemmus lemmus]